MKEAFSSAFKFWHISRILIALFLLISVISLFTQYNDFRTEEILVNSMSLLVGLGLLGVALYEGFSHRAAPPALKRVLGGFLVLLGLFLAVVLLFLEGTSTALTITGLLLALWIILVGVFEFLVIEPIDDFEKRSFRK